VQDGNVQLCSLEYRSSCRLRIKLACNPLAESSRGEIFRVLCIVCVVTEAGVGAVTAGHPQHKRTAMPVHTCMS
jgi:hypothetical protein